MILMVQNHCGTHSAPDFREMGCWSLISVGPMQFLQAMPVARHLAQALALLQHQKFQRLISCQPLIEPLTSPPWPFFKLPHVDMDKVPTFTLSRWHVLSTKQFLYHHLSHGNEAVRLTRNSTWARACSIHAIYIQWAITRRVGTHSTTSTIPKTKARTEPAWDEFLGSIAAKDFEISDLDFGLQQELRSSRQASLNSSQLHYTRYIALWPGAG